MIKKYETLGRCITEFRDMAETEIVRKVFKSESMNMVQAKISLIDCSVNLDMGNNLAEKDDTNLDYLRNVLSEAERNL